MEQKFEAFKKENPEELQDHFDFVRASVKDGSYFKDGLNWYFFRYVNPFCERTILSCAAIVACVITYCLYVMIEGAFPLVEKRPIIIRSVDQSQYFPNLVPLKPHVKGPGSDRYDPTITTVDEAILKYLISVYISDRESYDYSKAEIEDVNVKFNRIKNTSSDTQYREFQLYMSKDNPDSPILNFGRNVVKTTQVDSLTFIKKEEVGFANKAKNFITTKIPTDADVRFTTTTKTTDDNGVVKVEKQSYIAKINFAFSGAVKDTQKKDPNAVQKAETLGFVVKNYKLYKVN